MTEYHQDKYLCSADNRWHSLEYQDIATSEAGLCPSCGELVTIGTVRTIESDTETGRILYDSLSYWCNHGCELSSDEVGRIE